MGLAAKLLVVSSSLAYAALRARSAPVRFGLCYAAGVGFCIAGAASLDVPWLLGKRRNDGKVPVWSYIVFSTFHLGFRVYVKIRRHVSEEPVYTKVTPEWYVGGWPFALGDAPAGNVAVIDCTCELERTAVVADLPYLNLPAFDSRCPKLDYFHEGVRWALEQQQAGRAVFVHCAFGESQISQCVDVTLSG
jgi:hypothetical protein